MTQAFQWAMGGIQINQTTDVEKKMSSGGCAFIEKHWDGNERQKSSLHCTVPCLLMALAAYCSVYSIEVGNRTSKACPVSNGSWVDERK